jgi:hypothetical protein
MNAETYTPPESVRYTMQFVRDYGSRPNSPPLSRLLNTWNRLTCPAALRTDAEHSRCRRHARRVRSILERHYREWTDYREHDYTGKLVIPRRF